MVYRLTFFVIFSLTVMAAQGQETSKKDSLNLNRLLKGNKEININSTELKNIKFDSGFINKPYDEPISNKSFLDIDESLPETKKKVILSMQPYKPTTPYNWDPVLGCKIIQHSNGQWEPVVSPAHYNDLARARFLMHISTQEATASVDRGIHLGGNVYMKGQAITGLDLMYIFEKRFWDIAGNERRARTLEQLKNYLNPLYKETRQVKKLQLPITTTAASH